MPSLRLLVPIVAVGLLLVLFQVGMLHRQRPPMDKYPGHKRRAGLERRSTTTFEVAPQDTLQDMRSHRPTADSRRADGAPPTIFVSVAAFRDYETKETLRGLFARAAHPRRVFVGLICQMNHTHPEEACLQPGSWEDMCGVEEWCPADNVHARQFNASLSRGPTYARYLASKLYRGEDFFMMIDSHNWFEQDWDERILSQYRMIGKKKVVLSTYPMGYNTEKNTTDSTSVAYLCALANTKAKPRGWTSGFPGPFKGLSISTAKSHHPRPQPFLGAGLVFGPGQMVDDVPFDPHLPYIFFGEEFMIGIRLWTNGYDLYSPGVNILYHHYSRKGAHKVDGLGSMVGRARKISERRIHHILGITEPGSNGTKRIVPLNTTDPAATADLPKYGLGTVRSLWQYWKFSKLDPVKQNLFTVNNTVWCGRYGPSSGPYDNHWKTHTKENDIPSDAWWSNGVAKLAVPYTNAQLN